MKSLRLLVQSMSNRQRAARNRFAKAICNGVTELFASNEWEVLEGYSQVLPIH